jgi:hypothetical protein
LRVDNANADLERIGKLFLDALYFKVCIRDVRGMLATYDRAEIAVYTNEMFEKLDDICELLGIERHKK